MLSKKHRVEFLKTFRKDFLKGFDGLSILDEDHNISSNSSSSPISSQNFLNGLKNFETFNPSIPIIVCLHGNSSIAETFVLILYLLRKSGIQAISIDLPGCGMSEDLADSNIYTMERIGNIIKNLIEEHYKADKIFLFGHSLGGHLLTYIDMDINGIAIAGTPPMSDSSDFPKAFDPDDEAKELIPLLSQETPFKCSDAEKFVAHTGICQKSEKLGSLFKTMVLSAMMTDGRFRKGCLGTLVERNQIEWLKRFSEGNVIVFHAINDGVISRSYLELLDKSNFFQNKIHLLDTKHMSPLLQPQEMVDIMTKAWNLIH